MPADGGEIATVCCCFGGQGTLTTNSWAPESRRFAYVAYPAGPASPSGVSG
jgi:TolB protein